MKKNINIAAIIIPAILLGFAVGWIFKPGPSTQMNEDHNHEVSTMDDETIYTCSMHPQIRQEEPGLCPICEMDLIPVGQNLSSDPTVLTMTDEAIQLANVQTTIVGSTTSGSKSLSLTGKIEANETTASSIVAHVPGRIEKLYVSFTGENVRRGQKLIDIYSPELIAAQQELLEAQALSEVNPSLVSAAKSKLKNWKLSDEVIESILSNGKIQETFTFYAESSGVVNSRRVSVGDYVRTGSTLFDLIDLSKLWVVFDAYEEDLKEIRIGDRIQFTTPALGSQKFNTRVSFIDPSINPNTRTAVIRTEMSNKYGKLKPEMFVNGILSAKKEKLTEKILVPRSAVLWTGPRSVVYVKEVNTEIPSFKYQEVVLGERIGEYYQIEDGLELGDEVVTNGAFSIDAAAQLNNQNSMMNKNVKTKNKSASISGPNYRNETPQEFKSQLSVLTSDYMILKDAMVATNATEATAGISKFEESLENMDMTLLKGAAHMYWMDNLNGLKAHAKKISESSDIEEQRSQFEHLSNVLISSISAFGLDNKEAFVQYCPMAFDNEGASWISFEKKILNPYFGDKMLTCGSVTDTL